MYIYYVHIKNIYMYTHMEWHTHKNTRIGKKIWVRSQKDYKNLVSEYYEQLYGNNFKNLKETAFLKNI